jgi:hypothetical protein
LRATSTMFRLGRAVPAQCAPFALVAVVGCGQGASETPATGCAAQSCPFDYGAFDASSPITFQADVLPLLRRSCGLSSSCHGDPKSNEAGLYLGPALTAPEPDLTARQQIVAGLVGKPSKTAPSMSLVAATDPEHSFLMLKVDGCQSSAGLSCSVQPHAKTNGVCGDRMPQSSPALCAAERDVLRVWIAQGANAD